MREFKKTGGAKIGIFKSTLPFATLTVTPAKMELSVTVIGKFVFLPEDVKSITFHPGGYKMNPGIQIHHNVPHYKDDVIFWSGTGPQELLNQIKATGFLDNTATLGPQAIAQVRALQANGGFALKQKVTINLFALWIALIAFGSIAMVLTENITAMFTGVAAACGMIILFSILVLTSSNFASSALKTGYEVADIKMLLIFLMILNMFIMFMSVTTAFLIV